MNAEQIQKQLNDRNINYTIVAEAIGVSAAHVRNVCERLFTSRRVAEAVSTAIEKPLNEVFPDYVNKVSKVKQKARRSKKIDDLKQKLANAV